jgi:hypothetical protein
LSGDRPSGEPLLDQRPKRIVNRVREFTHTYIGPSPVHPLGFGCFAPRLPDNYALLAEAWADAVHRVAARKILDAPDIFPRGSIGFSWARKILNPGLSVVKKGTA